MPAYIIQFRRVIMKNTLNHNFVLSGFVFLTLMLTAGIPAISQTNAKSRVEASFKKSFENSSSYTIDGEQVINIELPAKDIKTKQKVETTTKYEDPYLHQKGTISLQSMMGNKKMPMEMLGKLGDSPSFFLKSRQQGGGWQDMSKMSRGGVQINMKKMLKKVRNPKRMLRLIQSAELAGKETVEGVSCEKITGKINQEEMQKQMDSFINQAMKMAKKGGKVDTSIDMKDGRITFWISSEDDRIKQAKFSVEQNIEISMGGAGGQKKRSPNKSWSQKQEQTLTYSNYDNTTVPSKMIDKLNELSSN